jgi:20S proteasome subunit beta 7
VVGFGGDVSDMQYLDRLLTSLSIEEDYSSKGHTMNAKNLHKYLSKVFYKRRSDFDPLWNQVLVAGLDEESKPFLASADLLGTTFSAPSLATGFGAHLAQPLLREVVPDEAAAETLDEARAVQCIKECMKVLFYRDARSMDMYSIAVVKKGAIDLKENEKLEGQSWALWVLFFAKLEFILTVYLSAETIRGYGAQTA